jgi:hypothetical protein
MATITGLLTIIAHEGKELIDEDVGKQDPFLELHLGKEKHKTKTHKKGGRNPKWDHAVIFNLKDLDAKEILHVQAWDEDLLKNDKLGRADIPIKVLFEQAFEKKDGSWFQLVDNENFRKIAGYVRFSIKWEGPHPSTFGAAVARPEAAPAPVSPSYAPAPVSPVYPSVTPSEAPASYSPAPAPVSYSPAPAPAYASSEAPSGYVSPVPVLPVSPVVPSYSEAPAYVAPAYVAPAYVAPAYVAPVVSYASATVASSLVGKSVAFRTHQGNFLCAEQDGRLVADRSSPREWEHFQIIGVDSKDSSRPRVNIRSHHGKYLCSDSGDRAVVNRDSPREWELWTIVDQGNGTVALQDYRGKYLCVEGASSIPVNRDAAKAWEALTPQVDGKAVSLSGGGGYGGGGYSSGSRRFALRAHTGKYLCAETDGRLVCDRDSAREWETFQVTPSSGGQVTIRSHHGKYLCSDSGDKAIVNRDSPREWEQWTVVEQGSGRVALRDYRGKYLCVERDGSIVVNRDSAREWETFTVSDM